MSSELAVKTSSPFDSDEFSYLDANSRKQLAVLAKSGLFPQNKDVYQAIAKFEIGRTLGISAIEALRGVIINPQNGQASFSAQLIASLIKKYRGEDGKIKYHYKYVEDEKDGTAHFTVFERIDGEWQNMGKLSWGKKEADAAGLSGKDTYKKYPKDMYFARGLTAMSRRFCADVFGGNHIYTHEEVQPDDMLSVDPETGEVYEVTKVEVKKTSPTVKAVLTNVKSSDKITQEQQEELRDLVNKADVPLQQWLTLYGKSSLEDLSTQNYNDMKQKLTRKLEISPEVIS